MSILNTLVEKTTSENANGIGSSVRERRRVVASTGIGKYRSLRHFISLFSLFSASIWGKKQTNENAKCYAIGIEIVRTESAEDREIVSVVVVADREIGKDDEVAIVDPSPRSKRSRETRDLEENAEIAIVIATVNENADAPEAPKEPSAIAESANALNVIEIVNVAIAKIVEIEPTKIPRKFESRKNPWTVSSPTSCPKNTQAKRPFVS